MSDDLKPKADDIIRSTSLRPKLPPAAPLPKEPAPAGPKPEELPVGVQPLSQDEEKHAEVELREQVILNGRRYGPGKCRIPEAAYDVWKNALKK